MPKVLIVDDDANLTFLLKKMLEMEPEDFEVHVVRRGGQALEAAQSSQPDLIMVDYNLNDMHGTDLIKQIRADAYLASTPVILASGLDVEHEALQAGANRFLLKPFEDPGELAAIILQLIG
ncbi:MAG: response regulator [Anaerolineae bacterium]|nr:response regulator [Anaerolineae bacterium]